MDIQIKKKAILKYLVTIMDILDPSKTNSKKYEALLGDMSDSQFTEFMNFVKDGKYQIHITMPNMQLVLKMENILKAAELTKTKLFSKLWLTDESTGRRYLTNHKYPILQLPVRRMEQSLESKMKVPESDRRTDALTGQVSGPDQKSHLSSQESQILHSKGLDVVLEELLRIRGGDTQAYGQLKHELEESGFSNVLSIDPNSENK